MRLYGEKAFSEDFFGLFFFCPPSENLPIGSLRGPKVFKKNFPKERSARGYFPVFITFKGYFQVFWSLSGFWGQKDEYNQDYSGNEVSHASGAEERKWELFHFQKIWQMGGKSGD